MSTHDSGRPPQKARRLVLRKIAATGSAATPLPQVRQPPPLRASAPSLPTNIGRSSELPAEPRSAPVVPAAPRSATSSVRTPPPLPSFPSLNRARLSVPPMVANLGSERGAVTTRTRRGISPRKAGVVGAALGLGIVALFVLGARLAYRSGSTGAASAPSALLPKPLAATTITPSATASPAPPPPSTVTAAAPAIVRPEVPRVDPGLRPRAPGGTVTAKAPALPPEPPQAWWLPRASSAAVTAAAAPSAPADSANPLIPVIPASPPPEVDPLVKAVLEEDNPQHK
jgi:hypothetical protein